jgi:hypothetical protein
LVLWEAETFRFRPKLSVVTAWALTWTSKPVFVIAPTLVLVAGEASGRGHRKEQDRVLGVLVVVGEVHRDAVAEEPRLEAGLDLRTTLGGQIRVPDKRGDHRGTAVSAGDRGVAPEGSEGLGLLAGLSVGGPELQGIEPRPPSVQM